MIKLTCTHEVEDYEDAYNINIKGYNAHGRDVHNITVCEECYLKYKEEDYILETWCDQLAWLDGEFRSEDK